MHSLNWKGEALPIPEQRPTTAPAEHVPYLYMPEKLLQSYIYNHWLLACPSPLHAALVHRARLMFGPISSTYVLASDPKSCILGVRRQHPDKEKQLYSYMETGQSGAFHRSPWTSRSPDSLEMFTSLIGSGFNE
jgi:hypothetical protein